MKALLTGLALTLAATVALAQAGGEKGPERIVWAAHPQQEIAALPVCVGVVRRPMDCLVHRSECACGVAEFFFCVAEIDPEIVVAIAQGRGGLK